MPTIHPSSSVAKSCELADDTIIGPNCVVAGAVKLGPGVHLRGSNYINGEVGPVTIGARTKLWPHACIGYEPQDYKFNGVTGGVVIGEDCMIREGATVHCSTKADRPTTLGSKVFLMVNAHVAHDCVVSDRVVMVNGSALAGHCEVGNDVTLGGNAVIHQFCRIGRMVMMSGDCAVNKDVPPFCIVSERNRIGGLNLVGLRRTGVPRDQITMMTRAFKEYLYRPMLREDVVAGLRSLAAQGGGPLVLEMAEFLSKSQRGFVTGFGKPPRGSGRSGRDEGADES
jgi:UDP-N-acetylglucosamine acyltransferase